MYSVEDEAPGTDKMCEERGWRHLVHVGRMLEERCNRYIREYKRVHESVMDISNGNMRCRMSNRICDR